VALSVLFRKKKKGSASSCCITVVIRLKDAVIEQEDFCSDNVTPVAFISRIEFVVSFFAHR
jgi:hypothetical protein